MTRWLPWFLGCLLTAGCAGPSSGGKDVSTSGKPPTRALIVTPDYSVGGKVVAVNLESHFVVLDFSVTGMPAIGQRLIVLSSGRDVAEVKVTGPQRDNHIGADILRGAPEVGDEVRETR